MPDPDEAARRKELFDTDVTDVMEGATTTAEERFGPIYGKIEDLAAKAGEFQSFDEWLATSGKALGSYDAPLAGVQALTDKWQTGPNAADYDAAFGHAARLTGLDAAQMQTMLAGLAEEVGPGDANLMSGLTDAEMEAMRRVDQATLRDMEARSLRLVQDTMADTNSTARMLQTASEQTTKMNSAQIAQDYARVQANGDRQVMQLQSKIQTWQTLLETNQMGVDEYISNLEEGASMAFQGYALEMNTIMQQNQELFQEYQGDLQAMIAGIEATYSAIQLEIGATAAELDYANQLYMQHLQPIMDELQLMITEQEMTFGWDDVWDGFVFVVGGAITIGGAIIGGILGGMDEIDIQF